ncbi:MAG: ribulose-phosphate 3-epimerase [Bacteroidales bacterium]|jgi:ribulose-phosphate 3-epimerase|nr:ribulose-phosphate 3-epimerase [Bacteroidales bacterium]MDD2280338.1 ribulose-phosphate 3-epimerase [Bacteroidales bacterium]MDD4293384.1 ribulose-phosphate 3-epimerase [Bacteroidales bacterium]MDD4491327.1 ribulose-phosphate 3-epimerase [Bacteroidales bacterium]HNW48883.1 ribulose-phosphate 3-epimerase [Bacteroidales bacterium]
MGVLVAPSMLSADFGKLDEQVDLINKSDADLFHLDIMDGLFVPNISYGFPLVKAIAKNAKKPLDAHLMIVDPDRYLEEFAKAGIEYLSVHWEACNHLHRSLQKIRSLGMKAGVALNPHTPVHMLYEILSETDFVLIMSVNPGFGGQKFIENSLLKIKKLKEIIIKISPSCLIEVDGGVTLENAPQLVKAGADILVAGNSVFGASRPAEVIHSLKQL